MRMRMTVKAGALTSCAVLVLLVMVAFGHDAACAAGGPVHRAASDGSDFVVGPGVRGAARRGNARAQAMLGYAYDTGQGVPQNFVVAVKWYRRAARQGDVVGQYLLAMMYDRGQGVHADRILAQKWLILATARARGRRRDDFRRIRDAVASTLNPRQLAHAQALAYAWTRRHRH